MKIKNKLYIAVLVLSSCLAVSCNDFLDEIPDNRAEVDSPEKIAKLLVSGYPATSYAFMAEMSSDNTDVLEQNVEYTEFQRELFHWSDITTIDQDTPFSLWANSYNAIASANMALKAIEELGDTPNLAPQKGEALLCRAYSHFNLVNIFCMHYGNNSSTDIGIPYITELETTVKPEYERGTVAEVYAKINADIEAGLPLVNDANYDAPKYHFNKKAAYAFAARFNLYYGKYDQVIKYANLLLGENPAPMLMNWAELGTLTPNENVQPNYFVATSNQASLMLISTDSSWPIYHGPFMAGRKYGHNQVLYQTETTGATTPWGNLTTTINQLPFINNELGRVPTRKMGYYMEYIDPVAGTGYYKMMYPAFVTDETLLCRAEAYIMTGEYDKAVEDMNTFMRGFSRAPYISRSTITAFYDSMPYYTSDAPTTKKQLNPDFNIASVEEENLIHAVLMLRRVLTIHEGLRWFDIKRYGIEISRRSISVNANPTVLDILEKDDLRRALQIPSDVISAGMTPNPR